MSLFRDLETRRWILKPKGISMQAEKVSVKGGGMRAGGCCRHDILLLDAGSQKPMSTNCRTNSIALKGDVAAEEEFVLAVC
jgi:hypothetical protein